MTSIAPYGSWRSPITLELVTEASTKIGQLVADGQDVYWTETRPEDGGRTTVVKRSPDGAFADVSPAGFSARSRVHEYGGGELAVSRGVVVATRFEDQRVYRLDGATAVAITPEPELPAGARYGDLVIHEDVVIAVQESHSEADEPVNELVAFPLDGSQPPAVIASGNDFYSSPRVSPDGSTLAWLAWDHPNMPWDGTELWVGALDADGSVSEPERVAGGRTESIFQPEWSPRGALHWVSDRTGWWNLYRLRDGEIGDLYLEEAEFGVPQWRLGMRRYAFEPDGSIVGIYVMDGREHLGRLRDGSLQRLRIGCNVFGSTVAVAGGRTWVVAGSSVAPLGVTAVDASGATEVVRTSHRPAVDSRYISVPVAIEFPTSGTATARAFWYPPTNPDFVAPEGERPPLLVISHGGPTSQASTALDLGVQFWTSRGFGVVDVDYRGSTGYGRPYRDALRGRWGIVDTEDCIAAGLYLAGGGHVDPDRMAIRGGSAGGYTTLCALTFHDEFAAGASYYGIGDLVALAEDTHKFESRYLDGLVGPYPEHEDTYRLRSPIYHIDELSCPVILFQGMDDDVVPPQQAEAMAAALAATGIPHALVAFEGEGHGFRKAETIKRSRAAELSFYGQVFGFDPADDLEPVEVAGL